MFSSSDQTKPGALEQFEGWVLVERISFYGWCCDWRRIWGQIAWHRGFQILRILLHPQQSMGSSCPTPSAAFYIPPAAYYQYNFQWTSSSCPGRLSWAGLPSMLREFRSAPAPCGPIQNAQDSVLLHLSSVDKDSGAHDWVIPGLFFTYQPSKSMELSVLDYIIIIKYSFIYIYIYSFMYLYIHSCIYIYIYKFIHVYIHSCIYSCKCIWYTYCWWKKSCTILSATLSDLLSAVSSGLGFATEHPPLYPSFPPRCSSATRGPWWVRTKNLWMSSPGGTIIVAGGGIHVSGGQNL